MFNVLGNFLTLSSFGESHGEAYGGIITNFPAGLEIDIEKDNKNWIAENQDNLLLLHKEKRAIKFVFCQGFLMEKRPERQSASLLRMKTSVPKITITSHRLIALVTPIILTTKNSESGIIAAAENRLPVKL